MTKCVKIGRTSKRVCIGALNRKIILYDREITAPLGESVDFGELFSNGREEWALVNTVTGKTTFDSTNTERIVSHEIYIRYFSDITSEKWVLLPAVIAAEPDVLLRIVNVENLNEENRFYLLRCTLRGDETKQVNWA